MRAVYQSTQAYLSLSYYDVNNYTPIMSDGYFDKQGIYHNPYVLGSCVEVAVGHNIKSYTFTEGENHNQLTLTDPTEIRNMRAYIKRRGGGENKLIEEILFEGDEADLEGKIPVEVVKQEEPVKRTLVKKNTDYEELSDWDKKLLRNMIRR